MNGIYLLLLQLDKSQQISIGRLGVQHFTKGFYAYVGSALNGLEARVNRHFNQNKKHHWHIDYLLDKAFIYEVVLIPVEEKLECTLAGALRKKLLYIRRFGSSDCLCPGHLFFANERNELETEVTKALADLGLPCYHQPHTCPLTRKLIGQDKH
jgi:Uri superfamily endonuclease